MTIREEVTVSKLRIKISAYNNASGKEQIIKRSTAGMC